MSVLSTIVLALSCIGALASYGLIIAIRIIERNDERDLHKELMNKGLKARGSDE